MFECADLLIFCDFLTHFFYAQGIGQNPLGIASCNAHQKSSNCEDTREREGKEHDFSPEKKNITSDLSLKSAVGTQEDMQLVKVKVVPVMLIFVVFSRSAD